MPAEKIVPHPYVLQPRDIDILRTLLGARVMTSAHVASMFFGCRPDAAKKRLQKLKGAGLLGVRPRKPFEPAVLFLTRPGILLLRDEQVLAEYAPFALPVLERRAQVGNTTVRHELEVMDVKVAFHSALKDSPTLSLAEFSTWPLLYQFEAVRPRRCGSEVLVKPDGFIRIHEQKSDGTLSVHHFFLEVDRSTETQDTLVSRASSYLDYYRSGEFAVRNGATRGSFKECPFRVLFVFKTSERRNNFAERLHAQSPPILSQAWLTTLDEVRSDPPGAVWTCPRDYRNEPTADRFPRRLSHRPLPYRRQTKRDSLVEKVVPKRSLF